MPERFVSELSKLLVTKEFYKIFLTLCLSTILLLPIVYMTMKKTARAWLKIGIEGENKQLDLNEVWEIIYMYIALGSWIVFVFMIMMKTLFGIAYSWEEYSLMFLGTAGSNGVSAWIIYLKTKNAK